MADNVKLFGMPAEKGRWIYVILGLTMNLCLGSVYSYSVFKPHVESAFGVKAMMGNLPFMIFLASFSVLMFFGGKMMEKLGARKLAIVGGLIVGLGWALSAFTKNIYMLTLTYGVVAGAGVGLAYGVPVAMGARWFPDKKGLAVGLMLAGFGGSALLTANIANKLIAIPEIGLFKTFLYFGIAFAIILVVLAMPFRFPEAGWKPQGWTPAAGAASAVDLDAASMVKTGSFWGIFLCYIIGCLAGLMAIGISKSVGSDMIRIESIFATSLVGYFAVCNAVGRPLFGTLTDKITPKWAAVLNLILILVASSLMLVAKEGTFSLKQEAFEIKDGKTILKDVTMIEADGKVALTKGTYVIAEGNVEKAEDAYILKEGSLTDKGDKKIITSTIISAVDKDAEKDLKQGAVILKGAAIEVIPGSVTLYVIAFVCFWLCLGGWLAIAPTATAAFYGMKNYARNYGVVFFAYGLGALLGGIISGFAKDLFGSYKFAFVPTAALAVVGLLLALALIKAPKKA